MKFASRLRAHALVIAAASLASQVALAADPIVSSSFTVSGLSYKLIDLDTTDGITPYIRFTDDSLASLSLSGARGTPGSQSLRGLAGAFISDLSLTRPDGNATAGVSIDGVHASNVMNLGDETKLIRGNTLMVLERNASINSRVNFELSANTQLVLEGTLTSDARVDFDALAGHPLLQGFGGNYGRFLGNAVNIVTVRLGGANIYFGRTDAAQQVTRTGVHPAPIGGTLYDPEDHETGLLSGSYFNRMGSAAFQSLLFVVDSRTSLAATVVPEASAVAYALCGAGGVLWLTARRRQRL